MTSHFDSAGPVDAVLCGVRAGSVKQVCQALAAEAAPFTGLDTFYLYEKLMELESGSSSGIGGGVAIPHLRIKKLTRPYTIFARLQRPVDFAAVDGEPVDMVVILLSPAADVAGHLQRLAHLSRLMRDTALTAKLRGVETPDGIRALLMDREAQNLAA